MSLKNVTFAKYPKLRDDRCSTDVDDYLIALYLKETRGWRIRECLSQTNFYMIEPLECFYDLDEYEAILTVGRDNYKICQL